MPNQINYINKPIGEGVHFLGTPVKSVQFIKQEKPQKNLWNAFEFGGYLMAELPEYPVSVDGLGFYQDIIAERNIAKQNTNDYAEFLRKYKINTVLETFGNGVYIKDVGFLDYNELLYEKKDWALVYFDEISVLYLRRTNENEKIIKRYEYRFLKRGLPPNYGASFAGLSEEVREGIEEDLNRCLLQNSDLSYCLIGKAAFFRNRKKSVEALNLLNQANAIDPNNPSLLLELGEVYREMGDQSTSELYLKRFQKVTNDPRTL
jgi:tetratricopeptide (TPR) repeat protein